MLTKKKTDQIDRLISDELRDTGPIRKEKELHQSMKELMAICDIDEDEIDFVKQVTSPSVYNTEILVLEGHRDAPKVSRAGWVSSRFEAEITRVQADD